MPKPIVRAEDSFRINATNTGRENLSIIPTTPYVEIQFRTNVSNTEEVDLNSEKPSGTNEWTTVSFREANTSYIPPIDQKVESSLKFDNFFENLTLEDSGGVVKCKMSLFDKDLERLENIIIKSVIATKGGNEVSQRKIDEVPAKAILEFMPNPSSNINFRLRFGYSDRTNNNRVFTPTSMSEKSWKERTKISKKDSIYIKSPWMYFMMMGLTFNLTPKGVTANVDGMSMSNTYLDKTKIIKRFALMRGNPQTLLKNIGEQIFLATAGRVQIVRGESPGRTTEIKAKPIIPNGATNNFSNIDYGDPSDLPIQWAVEPKEGEDTYPEGLDEEQKRELKKRAEVFSIDISLGGEPRMERDDEGKMTGKIINEYMSLKDLLRDFVSKVPPILRNKNTNKYTTDAEKIKQIIENKDNTEDPTIFEQIPYTYSINEQTVENNNSLNALTETVVVVRCFYRRLDKTKQEYVRSYDYRQSPKSIITSFNVKNKFDFIQLNQSIIVKGKELDVMLSTPSTETDENTGSVPANVTDYFHQQLNSNDFTLVNKIVENTGENNSNSIAAQVVKNMNEGIFFGNIEIIGDPFFLFDSILQPYQYYIKLNVYRNYNEYNKSNDKILKKSYLSGYYLVKKITHTLNKSGFKTLLAIEKYPTTGIET